MSEEQSFEFTFSPLKKLAEELRDIHINQSESLTLTPVSPNPQKPKSKSKLTKYCTSDDNLAAENKRL